MAPIPPPGRARAPVAVAIDGLAGAGKSTVSRRVASALEARYLDTGAMYRAITVGVLDAGADTGDGAAVLAMLAELSVDTDPIRESVRLGGRDVTDRIRSPEVTAAVSAVSTHWQLRHGMVDLQREIAEAARTAGCDIVVEGRDIGAEVLPDADVKVFLTASATQRAARRALQGTGEGVGAEDLSQVRDALERRDHLDSSRAVSPSRAAPDAVLIDSTSVGIEDVVEIVLELVERARVSVIGHVDEQGVGV